MFCNFLHQFYIKNWDKTLGVKKIGAKKWCKKMIPHKIRVDHKSELTKNQSCPSFGQL